MIFLYHIREIKQPEGPAFKYSSKGSIQVGPDSISSYENHCICIAPLGDLKLDISHSHWQLITHSWGWGLPAKQHNSRFTTVLSNQPNASSSLIHSHQQQTFSRYLGEVIKETINIGQSYYLGRHFTNEICFYGEPDKSKSPSLFSVSMCHSSDFSYLNELYNLNLLVCYIQ